MYSGQFYEEWRQKLVGVLLKFRDPDKEKSIYPKKNKRWTHLVLRKAFQRGGD